MVQLMLLKIKSGVGCHWNGTYHDVMACADDSMIPLSAASVLMNILVYSIYAIHLLYLIILNLVNFCHSPLTYKVSGNKLNCFISATKML